MCANRILGVRTAVYYGNPGVQVDSSGATLDIISSMRMHNDANILSLGARFITLEEAQLAVQLFIGTAFSGDERHVRRLGKF
jgi:ribose 5-phosphate isomerase B